MQTLTGASQLDQPIDMLGLIAADVLLRYPDQNLPFHIYTDATIMQNNQPIVYIQANTTMEK